MKKIPLIILLALISVLVKPLNTFAVTPPNGGCLEADILIVVDWSGSTQSDHSTMVGAIYAYSRSFALSNDGIKIGIVSFGDSCEIQSFITSDTSELDEGMENLLSDIGNHGTDADYVPFLVGGTMQKSTKERGRAPLRRFVIFISDGEMKSRSEFVSEYTKTTDALDITTFSIWLGEPIQDYLVPPTTPIEDGYQLPGRTVMKSIASQNCFFQSDYQQLRNFLIRLNLCI